MSDIPDEKVYKALITDDNRANRIVTASALRMMGLECTYAENGQEALNAAQKTAFDLIFMDCMMPVMNGLEATKAIRKLGGLYKDVPIIATTARIGLKEQRQYEEGGITRIVEKPVIKEMIQNLLEEFLPEYSYNPIPKKSSVLNHFTEEYFKNFCQNNRYNAEDLSQIFLEDSQEYLQKANEALKENQPLIAIKMIHALAGAASSLSANTLSSSGRALEKLLKEQKSHELIDSAWEHLLKEYKTVSEILQNI